MLVFRAVAIVTTFTSVMLRWVGQLRGESLPTPVKFTFCTPVVNRKLLVRLFESGAVPKEMAMVSCSSWLDPELFQLA